MRSPEFSDRLDKARAYRNRIAHEVRLARSSGLRDEARDYLTLVKEDEAYKDARKKVLENRWQALGDRLPEFSDEVWQEAGEVLSGINNGVKAAVFAIVAENTTPETYLSVNDIADRFKATFAGTELLEVFEEATNTKRQATRYCEDSLCGIGFLTAELNFEGKIIGFRTTERGRKYLPFAYYALWWETNNQQSLLPILGQTSSSGETRAPENTAKIIYYLTKHLGVREADVEVDLEMNHAVAEFSLISLHNLGLIDHKAVNVHTSATEVRYETDSEVSLDEAEYVTRPKSLQDEIRQIIQTGTGGFSCSDIIRLLPEETRIRWKENALRHTISVILSGLARQGILRRIDDFKGGEKQSHTTITQKGREFVSSLILPLLRIANEESLSDEQKGRIATARDNFTSLSQTSADLYYPHSKSYKKRAYQQNRVRVLEELLESKIPLRAKDLSVKMGLYGKTISRYLKPQLKGSDTIVFDYGEQTVSIKRTVEKGVAYYQVLPPLPLSM